MSNDIVPYRDPNQQIEQITKKSKLNLNPFYWLKRYLLFQFSWLLATVNIKLFSDGQRIMIGLTDRTPHYEAHYINFSDAPKIYYWLEEQPRGESVVLPVQTFNGNKLLIEYNSADIRKIRLGLKEYARSCEAINDLNNRKF